MNRGLKSIAGRTTGIVVTFFVAVLVAGGVSSVAATSNPSATLRSALLQIQDLPAGYGQDAATHSVRDTNVCGSKLLGSIKPVGQAEANFSKSTLGPFVGETLSLVPKGQGLADMAKEQSILAQCRTWTQTNAERTVDTYRLTRITFPKLEDQTLAYRIDVTAKTAKFALPAEIDFVLIRKGDVFINLLEGGIGKANSTIVLTLARTATQRLDHALG